MRLRWLLLIPLILLACGRLPEGIGSNHEIMVLVDQEQWERFSPVLREVFERKVFTAQEERVFAVRQGQIEEFDFYKKWKNLILLATFDRMGPAAELMEKSLSADARERVARGEAHLFARQNLWAQDQEVFFLVAETEQILAEKLRQDKDRIFGLMETALDKKIVHFLYERGEEVELEKRLFHDYGWTLRIPRGYRVVRELSEEQFVWLRRQQPQRWIFIHWEESEDVSFAPESCIQWRDRVGRDYYDGDKIVEKYALSEELEYAGRRALRISGIWENKNLLVGGPFRTYCFYDEEDRRRYLVDAAVYAAGTEKEPYLRQVDLIVQTFSTAPLDIWEQRP